MKQALVCVSFGTLVENGRADLEAVETALRDAAPGRAFFRAYTSSIIRRRLQARGVAAQSLAEVLEMLAQRGFEDVCVQPTHLLCGYEYDKIKAETAEYQSRFARLLLGEPLLAGTQDLQAVAQAVAGIWPRTPGEALVLMGHGTDHFAGVVYPALQSAFALQDRDDVFVATVEGWPSLAEILPGLRARGYKSVHLAPLLLVAGDHACHDMAGDDPDSWKQQLQAEGLSVRCTLQGLGRQPRFQQLYREKLDRMLG